MSLVCIGGPFDGEYRNARGDAGQLIRLEPRTRPAIELPLSDVCAGETVTLHEYRIEQIVLRRPRGDEERIRFLVDANMSLEKAMYRLLKAYGERDD